MTVPQLVKKKKAPRLLRNLKVYYSRGIKYTVEYTLYVGTEYFQHSLSSIPTNAQHIYIYINNILGIVNTPTCFDSSASFSGSLILLTG